MEIKIKIKNLYRGYFIATAMVLSLLSSQALAKDCEALKDSVNTRLQQIQTGIVKVTTLEQYQAAIHQRYDDVEELLSTANDCSKEKGNKDWKASKKILTALRSNARTMVFTKFEGWMEYKEKDLALFNEHQASAKARSSPTVNQKEDKQAEK